MNLDALGSPVEALTTIICIIIFAITMFKAFKMLLRFGEYDRVEESNHYRLYSAWEKARKYGAATSKRRHWE